MTPAVSASIGSVGLGEKKIKMDIILLLLDMVLMTHFISAR